MAARPIEWWLRPVSKAPRDGEHNAVVWKSTYCRPEAASLSIYGVAMGPSVGTELTIADVIQHNEQDIGRPLRRVQRESRLPVRHRVLVGVADRAAELGRRRRQDGAVKGGGRDLRVGHRNQEMYEEEA